MQIEAKARVETEDGRREQRKQRDVAVDVKSSFASPNGVGCHCRVAEAVAR